MDAEGVEGDLGWGRPEGGVKAIPSLTGSSSDGCHFDPSWVCPHTKLGVPTHQGRCAHNPRLGCPQSKAGLPTIQGWIAHKPSWVCPHTRLGGSNNPDGRGGA